MAGLQGPVPGRLGEQDRERGGRAVAQPLDVVAHLLLGDLQLLGNELVDPKGLLEGTGKRMRHVKVRPEVEIDEQALADLIE